MVRAWRCFVLFHVLIASPLTLAQNRYEPTEEQFRRDLSRALRDVMRGMAQFAVSRNPQNPSFDIVGPRIMLIEAWSNTLLGSMRVNVNVKWNQVGLGKVADAFLRTAAAGQTEQEFESNLSAITAFHAIYRATPYLLKEAESRAPLLGSRKGLPVVRDISADIEAFERKNATSLQGGGIDAEKVLSEPNLGRLGRLATFLRPSTRVLIRRRPGVAAEKCGCDHAKCRRRSGTWGNRSVVPEKK